MDFQKLDIGIGSRESNKLNKLNVMFHVSNLQDWESRSNIQLWCFMTPKQKATDRVSLVKPEANAKPIWILVH